MTANIPGIKLDETEATEQDEEVEAEIMEEMKKKTEDNADIMVMDDQAELNVNWLDLEGELEVNEERTELKDELEAIEVELGIDNNFEIKKEKMQQKRAGAVTPPEWIYTNWWNKANLTPFHLLFFSGMAQLRQGSVQIDANRGNTCLKMR